MTPRVLAIGLDGLEVTLMERLIARGDLPALGGLGARSRRVLLDDAGATRTGLAWEHFWSGLDPSAAHRPSAIEFDRESYAVWQEGARFPPFFGALDARTLVFDTPYGDFERAPDARGIVAWSAHDPGLGTTQSRPPELLEELAARVGPPPARSFLYSTPWASVEETTRTGDALVAGVDAREKAACWLLTERCADWDLAIVVVAETHSAAEALWHGIDEQHPLHGHPSAGAAAAALSAVYRAADRLVRRLVDATAPDAVVVFSMTGMGPNRSDTQSMVLLPELLARWALGRSFLQAPFQPEGDGHAWPNESGWNPSWFEGLHPPAPASTPVRRAARLGGSAYRGLSRERSRRRARSRPARYMNVAWQPSSWYRELWPEMRAFALPSFYDGRVRVNLVGREAHGRVARRDYDAVLDEITRLVHECVDPRTGRPVAAGIERFAGDPFELGSADADLVVVWSDTTAAFRHPVHGLVGPIPYRRTGGHTGPHGFAWILGQGVEPGDHGVVSSFDVAPTIVDLLGSPPVEGISGRSFLARATA